MDILTFENIQVTFLVLLAAAAAFASLYGVYKIIKEIRQPNEQRDKRLEEAEKQIEETTNDLVVIKEGMRVLTRAEISVLDHICVGNHVEQIKEVKTELESYLIKSWH